MTAHVAQLWTRRRPVRLNVVIHAAGSQLVSGRVRDIGTEEIYVETDHPLALSEGSTVRLSCMLNGELLITQGTVERRDGSGVHLVFADGAEMPEAIQDLISRAPPPRQLPAAVAVGC